MSVELKVPSLGESITEAVVGRWLKNVGDHVDSTSGTGARPPRTEASWWPTTSLATFGSRAVGPGLHLDCMRL